MPQWTRSTDNPGAALLQRLAAETKMPRLAAAAEELGRTISPRRLDRYFREDLARNFRKGVEEIPIKILDVSYAWQRALPSGDIVAVRFDLGERDYDFSPCTLLNIYIRLDRQHVQVRSPQPGTPDEEEPFFYTPPSSCTALSKALQKNSRLSVAAEVELREALEAFEGALAALILKIARNYREDPAREVLERYGNLKALA